MARDPAPGGRESPWLPSPLASLRALLRAFASARPHAVPDHAIPGPVRDSKPGHGGLRLRDPGSQTKPKALLRPDPARQLSSGCRAGTARPVSRTRMPACATVGLSAISRATSPGYVPHAPCAQAPHMAPRWSAGRTLQTGSGGIASGRAIASQPNASPRRPWCLRARDLEGPR